MATLTMNHSNTAEKIKRCCVVAIILRDWYIFFHAKYSLSTMEAMDLCKLKALNWRNLVHQHRQKQQ